MWGHGCGWDHPALWIAGCLVLGQADSKRSQKRQQIFLSTLWAVRVPYLSFFPWSGVNLNIPAWPVASYTQDPCPDPTTQGSLLWGAFLKVSCLLWCLGLARASSTAWWDPQVWTGTYVGVPVPTFSLQKNKAQNFSKMNPGVQIFLGVSQSS